MLTLVQSCPQGLTTQDLDEILGDRRPDFWRWMSGQTMSLCDGYTFIHNREHNEHCGHADGEPFTWKCGYPGGGHVQATRCFGRPHGVIVYPEDVERFLAGLPVID